MKKYALLFFAIVILAASLACGSDITPVLIPTSAPPAKNTQPLTLTTIPTTAPTITISSRCVSASPAQIENIRIGVKGVQESNDIKSVYAVRSNDYERIWFVAAEITGPSIQPKQVVGLWAISGEFEQPGLTYSVNPFAFEFSDWGDGTKTDAQLSQFDDGAQEAIACATDN